MKNVLLRAAMKLNKRHKQRKWWQRAVRAMGTVVVFCTTYALILPAITMEQEPVCGMEAHEHVESCYAQQTVYAFACGLSDQVKVVHSHDMYCCDAEGNLICLLPQIEEHTHDAACYEQTPVCEFVHAHSEECAAAETVLICTEEEYEAHTHDESCVTVEAVLVCTEEAREAHAHDEGCTAAETVLVCTMEESEDHTHGETCYEVREVPCELTEGEGHAHGEACYEEQEVPCALTEGEGHTHTEDCYETKEISCELTTNDGHVHEESCYEQSEEPVCGKEEIVLHTHEEACYDAEGVLICALPEIVVHNHTENCLVAGESEEQVLICGLSGHVHENACYPLEESEEAQSQYLCGSGVHAHMEGCYDAEGVLICTIPEHAHDATCTVMELDPNADVETAAQWEQTLANVKLTGIWSEDILAVAQSQLGYAESTRNVVQEGETLKGYTRYGAKYSMPYGDWDAMFVAFCLEYAEISGEYVPYETNSAAWINTLAAKGLYADAQSYTPVMGDLVFVDTDQNGEADHMGIISAAGGELQIIAGDTAEGNVAYETVTGGIVGYGILPQNPLAPEEWSAANEVAALVAALPPMEDVKAGFQSLNEQGDKAGYEALRQELTARMDAILQQYDSFNELQKERVGSMENMEALKELCGGDTWKQHPALTEDNALVSGLTSNGAVVIPAPEEPVEETDGEAEEEAGEVVSEEPEEAEAAPEDSIRDGARVEYPFTVETASYYTDVSYGEARIKVELILPLDSGKAVFDLSAMTWLEDPQETVETRSVNGADILCQVLTGYKRLTSDDENMIVVPGSFTEIIPVQVLDMAHGDKLAVIISAAMEQGAWDGVCETHQIEEKLTIVTETLTHYEPLPAEEQQAVYEAYVQELEALDSAAEDYTLLLEELQVRIAESYTSGELSMELYSELHQRLLGMSGVDLNSIAEPSVGNGWIWMDFGDPNYVEHYQVLYSVASSENAPITSAMPGTLYSSLELDSNSQIPDDGWGGENSADDVIWVSKTIEGTEQENVFDITLQIITKEEVNEVYKEPDMAVVIVMDISNTMTSIFSGESTVTRYDAAMTSAEQFLESFAEKTDGISRVGYVAFNTHAHQVFAMQECSTAAQAQNLANTMRTKTGSIMTSAANAAGGSYAESHDRFTNMQAGLKMAQDMLAGVTNQHKYIIFLSDGFPTTYLKSGYTGYDPYTGSGSNGTNGVFYDQIMGVHCDYGTSYSDTAAIKARELAVSLKGEGINIFSIGVDVAGQTIKYYHDSSVNNMKTFSVVERRQNADYYNTNGYEIGTLHSEITAANPNTAAMAQDFKNWLKGTKTSGIGSGYYYDSTDQSGLEDAYSSIFETILEMNAASAHLDWVATDPMPDMGVHELETMEFIGFWDLWSNSSDPVLVSALTGASQDNSLYYNTASFDIDSSTISWDLKNSGYQSVNYGNNKNFMCALKYRVRLQNENDGFIDSQIYETNDTTFLNYRVIEVKNGVTQVSDRKYIEFPIPKVFGYLSELNFMKVDPVNRPLSGAKFTLTHDTASCGFCRGDGAGYVDVPAAEAVSGEDGIVSFTNIPSGHHYILTEVEAPENYILTENTYTVVVSYDTLTVTVKDADGNPLDWTATIENDTYYTLPNTGGMGTSHFTFGGLLMITAALMYIIYFGRKRKKGGA